MVKNLSERLKKLHISTKTVFRTQDLASLWQEKPRHTVIIARRMVAKELIIKLSKGYYALNPEYNYFELANLIIAPSYVSFNSALFHWGVNFQLSNEIGSVALVNYKKTIDYRIFRYHSLNKKTFYNLDGINIKSSVSIAVPERALLDLFYFGIGANVDNWDKINKTYLFHLSAYYPKTVQERVKNLYL